jgi:hypothetical protein
MLWFFSQSIANHPTTWMLPWEPEGFMTIILQWGIALAILIKFNDWINDQPLIQPQVPDDEIVEVRPEYDYYQPQEKV